MTSAIPLPRPAFPAAMAASGLTVVAALIGVMVIFDARLSAAGRDDLYQFRAAEIPYLAAIASAAAVGAALMIRRPRHPAGWLFLALAVAVTLSGAIDAYAAYGAVARRGTLPAADFVAVLGDLSFIPWIMLLTLILLVTPEGRIAGRNWRTAACAAMAGGVVAILAHLLGPYRGDFAPLGVVRNPLALDSLAAPLRLTSLISLIVLHLVLIAAAGAILLRFRRAKDGRARQLRWMAFAAIPFPVLLVGAFVAAVLNHQMLLGFMAAGFVAIIPIATAFAIEQDHLFDTDRLLSRGLTYGLLTALVVGCYAVVVVFAGNSLGDLGGGSQAPAVIATLAAVSVALPLRRWLQDGLDRRFNRRRFDAVTMVQRFVREPSSGASIESVLRAASGDEALVVAYWIEDRALWVTSAGAPFAMRQPVVEIDRGGAPLARVAFDPSRAERAVIEAASAAGQTELENARLRAAIALQLVEVRESRSRIVDAQLAERHKIERNLHDGAQQRLLAIALQLRAAELSGDPFRAARALGAAIDEIQVAVHELRELANGLHPSVLSDGGLQAAFETLAAHSTVEIQLDVTPERFAPATEEAAWFIACEAVTNAVKHAVPRLVEIRACREDGRLRLFIEDDGIGGADPAGRGLRGIADRAEAAGGQLSVRPRPGGGTIVAAELPCAL